MNIYLLYIYLILSSKIFKIFTCHLLWLLHLKCVEIKDSLWGDEEIYSRKGAFLALGQSEFYWSSVYNLALWIQVVIILSIYGYATPHPQKRYFIKNINRACKTRKHWSLGRHLPKWQWNELRKPSLTQTLPNALF